MLPRHSAAFTLVELLVVIAIIVVLLAMLAPSLDKAVYQAELAVCGTRLKGVANSVNIYALAFKRQYPHRAAVVSNLNAHYLSNSGAIDDRKLLAPYAPINKLWQDPLSGAVDLERTLAGTHVYTAYNMWFGMDFKTAGEKAMKKLGDTLTWTNSDSGTPIRYHLRFLAGDRDRYSGVTVIDAQHPDPKGVMLLKQLQDQQFSAADTRVFAFSRWENYATITRGNTEMNFAFDDGAVVRYDGVGFDEWATGERMVRIPAFAGALNYPTGYYEQAPGH